MHATVQITRIAQEFRRPTLLVLSNTGAHSSTRPTAMSKKKLVNNPEQAVEDALEGLVAAQPGLQLLAGHRVVLRADAHTLATEGKVRGNASYPQLLPGTL